MLYLAILDILTVLLCQSKDLVKAYPPFVNFFEMSKDTIVRCEKQKPRFHAFLKVCETMYIRVYIHVSVGFEVTICLMLKIIHFSSLCELSFEKHCEHVYMSSLRHLSGLLSFNISVFLPPDQSVEARVWAAEAGGASDSPRAETAKRCPPSQR